MAVSQQFAAKISMTEIPKSNRLSLASSAANRATTAPRTRTNGFAFLFCSLPLRARCQRERPQKTKATALAGFIATKPGLRRSSREPSTIYASNTPVPVIATPIPTARAKPKSEFLTACSEAKVDTSFDDRLGCRVCGLSLPAEYANLKYSSKGYCATDQNAVRKRLMI